VIRVLVYIAPLVLAVYALVDCIQTPDAEVRGLPKFGWIALIVLIWVVGPLAWLIAGRNRATRAWLPFPAGTYVGGGRGARPQSPLAPDDDPDFLRRLQQERDLQQWKDKRSAPEPTRDEEHTEGGDDPRPGP
jgi:hypothetical protein